MMKMHFQCNEHLEEYLRLSSDQATNLTTSKSYKRLPTAWLVRHIYIYIK